MTDGGTSRSKGRTAHAVMNARLVGDPVAPRVRNPGNLTASVE